MNWAEALRAKRVRNVGEVELKTSRRGTPLYEGVRFGAVIGPRVAGETVAIRAGNVISIPPGPEYPHHIVNTSNAPLKYLSISTQETPEICGYPDSGKYAAFAREKGPLPGGGRMHRPDSDLDYWDGEP